LQVFKLTFNFCYTVGLSALFSFWHTATNVRNRQRNLTRISKTAKLTKSELHYYVDMHKLLVPQHWHSLMLSSASGFSR